VLRDVELIVPEQSRAAHRDLEIRDGRIHAVRAHAAPDAEAGAPDTAGRFVLPGLVDMHVHYPPRLALGNAELWSLLFLAHGVTTVRETGSIDGSSLAHRARLRAGELPGPRLLSCGAMLDGDPPSFPSNRRVHDAAEARRAVAELAAAGVDCVKVYNMLSPPAFAAIRSEARARGLPLVGHKPHAVPFEAAGIGDLQHFTGAVVVDLERVARQDFRFRDWEGVDAARIAHVLRVAREQGIAFTPTLVNARQRLRTLDPGGPELDAADSGLRHLPRFWWTAWRSIWGPAHAPGEEAGYALYRGRLDALSAAAWRAGISLHAGTDTLMPFVAPGSSLHGELAELSRAGIPLEAAWALATWRAGRALGIEGLGTLAPGAPADLLLFRQDPTRDLAALGSLDAVVAGGRLYTREWLDDALARYDAHFRGALYDAVLGGTARLAAGAFAPRREAE